MDRLQLQLQWGNIKRLRCVKVKPSNPNPLFNTTQHHLPLVQIQSPNPLNRDLGMIRSETNEKRTPEKEDRFYTTRGSGGLVDEGITTEAREDKKRGVWPKLYFALSNKEKEEDFMAMKGCRLPQRPKKRAKLIQRSILLVSPGAWLSDLCQERYEKPRGLKAMECDSE